MRMEVHIKNALSMADDLSGKSEYTELELALRALAGAYRRSELIRAKRSKDLCMVQWQPIETAPTDGTEILLANFRYNPISNVVECRWVDYGVYECVEYPSFEDNYSPIYDWSTENGHAVGDDTNPTHWMKVDMPKKEDFVTVCEN